MDAASIIQMNKVRVSLGMAPLPVPGKDAGPSFKAADESGSESDDLSTIDKRQAAAGLNWQRLEDERLEKEEREKRKAAAKKARNAAQRYAKMDGKGLGEADEEEMDTRAWLLSQKKRQKKIEKTRKLEEELAAREREALQQEYTSKDLAGVKVGHEAGEFDEATGEQVLTLKDTAIGEESEDDELENAELRAREKLEANLKLKKKRPDYDPMAQDEEKTLLSKYDEEIDGKKSKRFTLDGQGSAVETRRQLDADGEAKGKGVKISLDMLKDDAPASDYLDPSKIKVKKPKKQKEKKTRQKAVDEDDIIAPVESTLSAQLATDEMDVDGAQASGAVPSRKRAFEFDDDDLQAKLAEQRRQALKKRKKMDASELARQMRDEMPVDDEDAEEGGMIMDETSEFVANLKPPGAIEVGEATSKTLQPATETTPDADEADEDGDTAMGYAETADAEDRVASTSATAPLNDLTATGLEDESTLSGVGTGAALEMLRKRGQIANPADKDLSAKDRQRMKFLEEKKDLIKDWDDRAKAEREAERKNGTLKKSSAQEQQEYARRQNEKREIFISRLLADMYTKSYRPDVKLEYHDEFGRSMNQKEAFKHMSHAFHGKGSGKGKMEKRLKKIGEEKAKEGRGVGGGEEGGFVGVQGREGKKLGRAGYTSSTPADAAQYTHAGCADEVLSETATAMSSDFDDEDYSLQSIDIPFTTPPHTGPDTRNAPSPFKRLSNALRLSEEADASSSGGGQPGTVLTSDAGSERVHHAWLCDDCGSLHVCEGEASHAPLLCGDEADGVCKGTGFRLRAVEFIQDGTGLRVELCPMKREVVMRDGEVVEVTEPAQTEGFGVKDLRDSGVQPVTGASDACDFDSNSPEIEAANIDDGESSRDALPHGLPSDDGCATEHKDGDDHHHGGDHANPADDFSASDGDGSDTSPPASGGHQPEEVWDDKGKYRVLEQPKLSITLPCRIRRYGQPALSRWDSAMELAEIAASGEQDNKSAKDGGSAPIGEARQGAKQYTAGKEPRRHLKLDDRSRVYAVASSPISPDDDVISPPNGRYATEYRVYNQSERKLLCSGVLVPHREHSDAAGSKPSEREHDREHTGADFGVALGQDADIPGSENALSSFNDSDIHITPQQRNKRSRKRTRPRWSSMRGAGGHDPDYQQYHVKLGKHVVYRRKRQASTTAGPSSIKRACDEPSPDITGSLPDSHESSMSVTAGDRNAEEQPRMPVSGLVMLNTNKSPANDAPAPGDTLGDPSHATAVDDKWTCMVTKPMLRHAVNFLRSYSRTSEGPTQSDIAWSGELPRSIHFTAVGDGEKYAMQRMHASSLPDEKTITTKSATRSHLARLLHWQKTSAIIAEMGDVNFAHFPSLSHEHRELMQESKDLVATDLAAWEASRRDSADPFRRKEWENLKILQQVHDRINERLAAVKTNLEKAASAAEPCEREE
ncbi:hypothetical protein LTR87_016979 [Friedmanniomyces endolithicus]|nr:hypothetical protein LTR87_016979 [Friedmanniomyces endolithicus]